MSTNYNDMQQHDAITASISTIGTGGMEMENSALADTPGSRLQRLVKVYGAIKPLLTTLSALVIIPPSWRAGLAVFVQTLDAVVIVAPRLDPAFKAGKDLDK